MRVGARAGGMSTSAGTFSRCLSGLNGIGLGSGRLFISFFFFFFYFGGGLFLGSDGGEVRGARGWGERERGDCEI